MAQQGFVARKKPFFIAIAAALLITGVLTLFIAIPKTASLSLPYRWSHIPLGYKRSLLHQYFGHTTSNDTTFTPSQPDEWIAYRRNGLYRLVMHYNQDSLSTHYQVWYTYKLGFFHKSYILKEEDAKQ
ncbi:hypothetical protein [Deminuibacter soli]|uniref:Uncharacterized protein n=1 Tax=Deminuibacter soli TaxID=2291815 RepID=A0A3E1NJN3_9BACT|nr:hypothetical protein [Deminuibacter soli]RFM28145.1 hypothetical protein DXN05_11500 [Deminuibacter soli]